ncbi:MAG: hypothetical protein AAF329_05745 [Cyanobacteria bacterium P01_A01_bin.17]
MAKPNLVLSPSQVQVAICQTGRMDALEVAEYWQSIGLEALPANDAWGVLIFVGTLVVAAIATYNWRKA